MGEPLRVVRSTVPLTSPQLLSNGRASSADVANTAVSPTVAVHRRGHRLSQPRTPRPHQSGLRDHGDHPSDRDEPSSGSRRLEIGSVRVSSPAWPPVFVPGHGDGGVGGAGLDRGLIGESVDQWQSAPTQQAGTVSGGLPLAVVGHRHSDHAAAGAGVQPEHRGRRGRHARRRWSWPRKPPAAGPALVRATDRYRWPTRPAGRAAEPAGRGERGTDRCASSATTAAPGASMRRWSGCPSTVLVIVSRPRRARHRA